MSSSPKKMKLLSNENEEECANVVDSPPPIMSLPDELLSYIFSFVNGIRFKFTLESVCQRFQRVSKLSSSWTGIDRLDLQIECRENASCRKMGGRYDRFNKTSLNGRRIVLDKWPAAIDMLLKRAMINKFSLHFDQESDESKKETNLVNSILSVLQDNRKHLALKSLQFHLWWAQGTQDLVLWTLEQARPTLKHLLILFENRVEGQWDTDQWLSLWAAVNQCASLDSFYVAASNAKETTEILVALKSKPLTKLGFCSLFPHPIPAISTVCNNASGTGVESLYLSIVGDLVDLSALSSQLDDCKRAALKNLSIDHLGSTGCAGDYLNVLAQLPRLFPSLTSIEINFEETRGNPTDVDWLLNASFFDACHQDPVERYVVFSAVNVERLEDLREAANNLGETSDVEVAIDNGSWPWMILSRGNATIRVDEVNDEKEEQEEEQEEDHGYPYDFDDLVDMYCDR